jgi:hypothetical protein
LDRFVTRGLTARSEDQEGKAEEKRESRQAAKTQDLVSPAHSLDGLAAWRLSFAFLTGFTFLIF